MFNFVINIVRVFRIEWWWQCVVHNFSPDHTLRLLAAACTLKGCRKIKNENTHDGDRCPIWRRVARRPQQQQTNKALKDCAVLLS